MKKIKNMNKNQSKSRTVFWIVLAFVVGYGVGYATHYLIVNWHSLFVSCPNESNPELCCPNGSKPDKHGCCNGEVYTDAGGGWMVCCPDGGDNCFPSIK